MSFLISNATEIAVKYPKGTPPLHRKTDEGDSDYMDTFEEKKGKLRYEKGLIILSIFQMPKAAVLFEALPAAETKLIEPALEPSSSL